jgi:hypothetical protein
MVTQLVRHMTTSALQRKQEQEDSDKRWLDTCRGYILDIFYNTQQRVMKHGATRKELAETLHKMVYEESYFDVFDGEDKDYKVRVFFEPLIALFKGNKRAALVEINKSLESLFPIDPKLNREWNAVWVNVPYKPKRKSDKRTKRYTLRFDWAIKKPNADAQKHLAQVALKAV